MEAITLKKIVLLILVFSLMTHILTACGNQGESGEGNDTQPVSKDADHMKKDKSTEDKAFSYPMKDVDLTWWLELTPSVAQNFSNLGDTAFAKNLQQLTGADIEFIHPTIGQTKEQFNLLVVSGNYPDIMEYNIVKNYIGGPAKALEDGVIMDITDYIPKYAPHLYKFYQENPEYDKLSKTDDGRYYSFPFVRTDDYLKVYFGPVVNHVWLEKLGLDYPETMDDWYHMLTLFKEKMGATAPLTFEPALLNTSTGSPFIGAFGIAEDFYMDENGDIQYGSIQPGYKKFLATFAKWYEEGLLDSDFASVDRNQVAAKLTTGESGASMGYTGSRLGVWLKSTEDNPDIDFIGVKYPVEHRGDIPKFTQRSFPLTGQGAYISTTCTDVEAAMRVLDYAYSEEGKMFHNFGIEGESYDMIDGYPTYKEFIMKNTEKPVAEVLGQYVRATYSGPFPQMREYNEQYGNSYEQQVISKENWTISETEKYTLPNITPTPEESAEIASILSEVNTYRDEMQTLYILGLEELSTYDTYVQNIKDMGIDRVIELYTKALERFNNR